MVTIEQISTILRNFQRKEIPTEAYPGYSRASVLFPLFPKGGELYFLLTVRTDEVESHKGQISFPGGGRDNADRDAIHTALREAEEEAGLQSDDITILGLLNDRPVISKFIVTPVVGYIPHQPLTKPNPLEVREIFDVPLSFFINTPDVRSEQRSRNGWTETVWFYQFGKHTIWGATAAIIRDFITVLDLKQD